MVFSNYNQLHPSTFFASAPRCLAYHWAHQGHRSAFTVFRWADLWHHSHVLFADSRCKPHQTILIHLALRLSSWTRLLSCLSVAWKVPILEVTEDLVFAAAATPIACSNAVLTHVIFILLLAIPSCFKRNKRECEMNLSKQHFQQQHTTSLEVQGASQFR